MGKALISLPKGKADASWDRQCARGKEEHIRDKEVIAARRYFRNSSRHYDVKQVFISYTANLKSVGIIRETMRYAKDADLFARY